MTRRARLRALAADVLWQLAHVESLVELEALRAPVARLEHTVRCDPPTCRALALAYRQTERRLINRAWGGLLDAFERIAQTMALAVDQVARAMARLAAQVGMLEVKL